MIRKLLEKAVFELTLSALILLAAVTGTVRKLVGVISWVECQLSLLSATQEEVRDGIGLSQERLPKSSMESFRACREVVEDEINSDSNSQHSVEGPERPGLSSFPALTHQENPLEKDTLEVPVLGTSSGPGTVTPLEASPSTPQDTATITPPVITPRPTFKMSTFRFPMPVPGSEDMPYFSGANITEFIERFEELCDEYQVVNKKAKLPRYCDSARREIVKSLP